MSVKSGIIALECNLAPLHVRFRLIQEPAAFQAANRDEVPTVLKGEQAHLFVVDNAVIKTEPLELHEGALTHSAAILSA